MKKVLYLSLVAILGVVAIYACTREDVVEENNTGTVSFFTKSDLGNIDIFIEGKKVGTIRHYHAGGVTCGQADVNVKEYEGTHSFTASSTNGTTWASSVTFTAGVCNTMELTGSNGGGGGGGGNSNCKQYSLVGKWLRTNSSTHPPCVRNEVITFNGSTGTVTSSIGCCFPVGDVKWKGYNQNNCTIYTLNRGTNDCSIGDYSSVSVIFSGNNYVAIGNVGYTRVP
ncbi:hypothetical protein BWD42_11380 [Sphingobacterium sp. CZ-UAM]|uniref:hypothetical protein n=1 Tax=Sphingobacterium sp. CZ-UAM TaxID=1933868 RepID=UPI000986C812|nr:hypothetical protein [Sphingobacterium sp. CZ-UAM]OOG17897.1 hypothetical protein BWD42_11380 [Sphingobacterium sp. CZ-UAM]